MARTQRKENIRSLAYALRNVGHIQDTLVNVGHLYEKESPEHFKMFCALLAEMNTFKEHLDSAKDSL